MSDLMTGSLVLVVSVITLIIIFDLSRWSSKRTQRLSARLTEVRTMDFLSYLTETLSGGQATTLLDELMEYYTSYRASEGERGAETVSVVLSRLEPIKGELRSILSKARSIDQARNLEENVRTEMKLALTFSWLFILLGAVLFAWSLVRGNDGTFLVVLGAGILDFCFALYFLFRGIKNANQMAKEALPKSQAEASEESSDR
jgi:hypothetical protein